MYQKRARAASGSNTAVNPEAVAEGSGAGLPPSADKPDSANSSSTTSRKGTGETYHAARGKKRSSEGDDDDRHDFEREEDQEVKRSTGASSSKATWGSGQAPALLALLNEA